MFNTINLIHTVGYAGLFLIVFAESGLFIGFFLPGDSLLFTAGFLASQGYGDITTIALVCLSAAVLGDSFGYAFGRRLGPKIFTRDDGIFFRKAYVERISIFYARYGGKAIVLARFTPVLRTFAPIFAGVGGMPYGSFLLYNVGGGLLWAGGLVGLGFMLGHIIPGIDRYLLPVIAVIIGLSVLPSVVGIVRERRRMRGSENI
jgi:membrane-associated protein